VKNKKEFNKKRLEAESKVTDTLRSEIKELEKKGEYFKALKRYFSLGIVESNIDEDILNLLNSDYGRMYKFVNFLKLVVEMIEQDFKPVSIAIIRNNLEYIKQFASHIVLMKVEPYLHSLNKIIITDNIKKMKSGLNKLVEDCSNSLNEAISKEI
jgi:hypothetical protein